MVHSGCAQAHPWRRVSRGTPTRRSLGYKMLYRFTFIRRNQFTCCLAATAVAASRGWVRSEEIGGVLFFFLVGAGAGQGRGRGSCFI
jgi:hypothetical protein